MAGLLPLDIWYIVSALVSPIGFVFQDVVADAMTVEAVPRHDENGAPIPEKDLQRMHVTMQTLGRIAIIGGRALGAGIGPRAAAAPATAGFPSRTPAGCCTPGRRGLHPTGPSWAAAQPSSPPV